MVLGQTLYVIRVLCQAMSLVKPSTKAAALLCLQRADAVAQQRRWAVGVLIFEMAAGYPPFYSENKVEIFRAICAAQYTFPEHFTKVLMARLLWVMARVPNMVLPTAQHRTPVLCRLAALITI